MAIKPWLSQGRRLGQRKMHRRCHLPLRVCIVPPKTSHGCAAWGVATGRLRFLALKTFQRGHILGTCSAGTLNHAALHRRRLAEDASSAREHHLHTAWRESQSRASRGRHVNSGLAAEDFRPTR